MSDERPTEWLQNLRRGDEDAARKLFAHFSKRLCQLAQRHLSSRLQQRVDGEDVVQSVFRTFFIRDSKGQFEVDHSNELWRLLVTITLRKARGIWRQNATQARRIDREVPLTDGDGHETVGLLSREPSVIEAIVLADEIETLLTGLSEQHSKALELRLGGYTPTESAEIMGISRQSFYRLIDPLKERLLHRGIEDINFGFEIPAEEGS